MKSAVRRTAKARRRTANAIRVTPSFKVLLTRSPALLKMTAQDLGQPAGAAGLRGGDHFIALADSRAHLSGPLVHAEDRSPAP